MFVVCLFCGFSCADKGTGKLRAGNGWGVSLTVLLVLLLGLGRKTWSAAAEEAGGAFLHEEETQGSGTVCKSGNLTRERGERRPQKKIGVSCRPCTKGMHKGKQVIKNHCDGIIRKIMKYIMLL